MAPFATDWLNYLVRWIHLLAGISWIGSSFYFMWLDSHLTLPTKPSSDVEGELWMVHSGGFYQVLRKKIGPGTMPKELHWFKFEALFTWLTGMFLLGLVYYMTNGAYLLDPGSHLSPNTASGFGLSLIVFSWIIYDGLWVTIGKKFPALTTGVCLVLVGALAYLLCQVFSGRGAFIHLGAIFGTIMVANVWMRILPAQQKMIDATEAGRTPDYTLSGYAKRRSVHNSYMTFPVIFAMLSNHYSMAYSHAWNWVVLVLLVILGMCLRHVTLAGRSQWAWAPAAIAAAILVFWSGRSTEPTHLGGAPVSFQQVQSVIQQRCLACHSNHPTDAVFTVAPSGILLETPERIKSLADRIHERVVVLKTMPFANKTGMTDDERNIIGRWIEQGASIDGVSN